MTPQFKAAVTKYGPRFLSDTAFNRIHVAAMFGNFAVESDQFRALQEYKPTVKGSAGGWGWAQWTGYGKGGRRGIFERWAKAQGLKFDDPEAFYGFVLHEFATTEKGAYDAVRRTKTLDSATTVFMKRYERPGVPHLEARKARALEALTVLDAVTGDAPVAVAAPIEAVPPVAWSSLPAGATDKPGKLSSLWSLLRGKPPLAAATETPVAAQVRGDPTVWNVQNALKRLGYTEVGTVDGLMGGRTQDAILAARKANGLPLSDKIDPAFLAALSTMPARPVSAERATADTSTVRANAPGLLDGLGGVRVAAGTLFGGSLLGGAQDTGLLDTIKGTAEQATDTMQSVQSVVATGMGAVSWIANHWWIFGLLLGIWLLVQVGTFALKVVTFYRTGRLL